MYLCVMVLKKEKLLKRLMTVMVEFGMYDATVLDGEGIESIAAETSRMFSALRGLFTESYLYNKTILAPVRKKEEIDEFIRVCAEGGVDFSDPETGSLMLLPCERILP